MKVVATVSLAGFPDWKMCMEKLRNQVDEICVRIDGLKDPNAQLYEEVMDSKLSNFVVTTFQSWNRWNWREDMARMADAKKPDIVLTPDQDEVYTDEIITDLSEFYKSNCKTMIFNYHSPMPTDDGRDIPELNGNPYPSMPHCKGYRWQDRITYNPYVGRAIPTSYFGHPEYNCKSKILHYCMFTKELEEQKKKWVINEYGIF